MFVNSCCDLSLTNAGVSTVKASHISSHFIQQLLLPEFCAAVYFE